MLLEELAEDLVSGTSDLLDGRTVNVMNTEGYIVASTDPLRVGTFHQGAREAVLRGKPVDIPADQVGRYPGAKEGCNMPLRVGGQIVGVVGINGNPPEIRYLAHLAAVYAEKCYQLEALVRPQYAQGELRSILLGKILARTEKSLSDAQALLRAQHIGLDLPVTVALLSGDGQVPMDNETAQREVDRLLAAGSLRQDRDVWGMADGSLVLLLSQPVPCLDALEHTALRLSISLPAQTLWDIQGAYRKTVLLNSFSEDRINCLSEPRTRLKYTLFISAMENRDVLEDLCLRLEGEMSEQDLHTILKTAQCYYQNDRSVAQAAEKLYIHKNTLLYRVHKLLDALDLADAGAFRQEYTVRLLLEHYKRKHGLRAL